MKPLNYPAELLDEIFAHLPRPGDSLSRTATAQTHPLLNARLVCRAWNASATKYAFRNVTLVPTKDGLERWNQMLNSETVRLVARCAIFCSFPDKLEERYSDAWLKWESEFEYPELQAQISRISELANLDEIKLIFAPKCKGRERGRHPFDDKDIEYTNSRQGLFKAVFQAIRDRAIEPKNRIIHIITMKNLQNQSVLQFTPSDLLEPMIKQLTELHIDVMEEHWGEHGSDSDIMWIERVQFEPYLQKDWLAPVASHLTSLSLYFHCCWGTLPGTFSGHGLVFPHLKSLKLGSFAISHHDHFDWVLSQPSLTSLQLDCCFIVSHMHIWDESEQDWHITPHDWDKLPLGVFGFRDTGYDIYHFPGTWEAVFDKIRTKLPNLIDFQFHINNLRRPVGFDDPAPLPTRLSLLRYIAFDIDMDPSPWVYANPDSGVLPFGNGKGDMTGHLWGRELKSPNKHEGTLVLNPSRNAEIGDERALRELIEATLKRRWQALV